MSIRNIVLVVALMVALAVPASAQLGNTAILVGESITAAQDAATVPDLRDIASFAVGVKNAGTYQLEFEASFDGGTTYTAVYGYTNASPEVLATSATAPGVWFFRNRGFSRFRVRASAYTNGAPRVTILRGYAQ